MTDYVSTILVTFGRKKVVNCSNELAPVVKCMKE